MEQKRSSQISNKVIVMVALLLAIMTTLMVLATDNTYVIDIMALFIIVFVCFCGGYVKNNYLTYSMLFYGMGFLYAVGPILCVINGTISKDIYERYYGLIVAAMLSLFGYAIGSILGTKIAPVIKTKEEVEINHALLKAILISMLAVIAISKLYMLSSVGLDVYVVQGRAAAKKLISERFGYLGLLDYFLYLIEVVAFEMMIMKKKAGKRDWTYKLICVGAIVLALIVAIIQVDRSSFLLPILPIVFMLNYHKYIDLNRVILFGGVLLIGFVVWKQVIPLVVSGALISAGQVENGITLKIPAEIYTWYNVGGKVYDGLKSGLIEHKLGYTYLMALESIVNPFWQDYTSLSTWFVKTFYYDYYLSGGGMGFSCILESILNFGIGGPFFVFMIYGFVNKFIEQNMSYSHWWRMFYALSLSFVYKIFRSEIYSIVKNQFWMWIVPLVLLWFVTEKIRFRSQVK